MSQSPRVPPEEFVESMRGDRCIWRRVGRLAVARGRRGRSGSEKVVWPLGEVGPSRWQRPVAAGGVAAVCGPRRRATPGHAA